tara:strand:- start:179 stop:688 length:510 start_codon:yes stop_codon:yes gene_type:complete
MSWKLADQYYENAKEGISRKNGLLYKDNFSFPIGVKEHGCCCVQKYPPKVDVKINVEKVNINEVICYEDYTCGTPPCDYMICHQDLIPKIIKFWKDYNNNNFFKKHNNGKEINSIHSYDVLNIDWWNYKIKCHTDDKLFTIQMKLFFLKEQIKIKQLRFMQDISFLLVR